MKTEIEKILASSFAEDIGTGDATGHSVIPADSKGKYVFKTREDIVFCGAEVISIAFSEIITKAKLHAKDGEHLKPGTVIAEVHGDVREILAKERTVLNLIQILSGIATETAKYVAAVEGAKAKVLDTRKTIPGLRALSKYAVKCGGGQNHRMGLYDMVMIKDNHIKAAGGVVEAVAKARSASKLKVEVECDTLEQVKEALAAKADIIMADNMNSAQLKQVVELVNGKALVEASGNVNLQTIRAIADTGVDYISTSKITMSAKAVDIGLDEATD